MMGMRIWRLLCVATLAVVLASAQARAQSCSDGNECTNPDMCADGTCSGTVIPGACDDGNPCTINDTCVSGVCQGTPNIGATCGMTGCEGTCGPNGICLPDPDKQGEPCTDGLGACTTDDVCTGTFCFGSIVQCPDADNNKCTPDVCLPNTGQCVTLNVPVCGDCETCDGEGACVPANDGATCDDGKQCTGDGKCQSGACLAGAPLPTEGTPTNTPSTPAATDTATPTQTEAPPTDTPGGPTATQTSAPTDTATVSPSDTPTTAPATPTDSPTAVSTDTPTVAPATPTDTETPTDLPTETPTDLPTETPTGVPTGTATATFTPTGIPTGTATATVTFTPTGIPTGTTTATVTPTGVPTGTATATVTPTGLPTGTATATVTASATGTVTATRTITPTVPVPATSTATATRTPLPVVASIIVGSATGEPGATVSFDTSLNTESSEIAGVQVDIAFDAKAAIVAKEDGKPKCTVNPDIEKDATSFAFQPSGCTPGEDCTGIRAIVLSLADLEPIPTGSKLFTCDVALAADATGTYPLTCSNSGAGNVNGDKVGADCTDGTITVAVPTDATVVVGDVVGVAGQDATLSVSLQTEVEVAGTQNDITFPAGIGVVAKSNGKPQCTVNEAIEKGGTSFAFQPSGCTPGDNCTGVRALVLALDNVDPIPGGSVLYTCEVAIDSDVASGTYPLVCTNQGASDPDGKAVPTDCDAGDVFVGVEPTATSTPTETPTATLTPVGNPTATVTNTPSATPSASATATRTRKPKDEDDGCQVVAPAESGAAWLLLLPVAALLWRRRR